MAGRRPSIRLPHPSRKSPVEAHLNRYVQDITHTVDDPYLLNEDDARCNGVTQNRHFQDRLLARAHSNSSGSLLGHHLRGVLQGHAGTQS